MRLIELVSDWIAESSLFEMAHERKKALQQVRGLQFTLSEHLVKILHFNSPENLNRWISEVNGYLSLMDRIRVKGGKPKNLSPRDFQLILWEEPLGHGVESVSILTKKHLKRDYPNVPETELSDYQIYEILHKIYSDLVYDIPNNRFEDIRNYLHKYTNIV